MTIGQQINLIRNKRNITLDQLAMMSGVSKSTINSWIYRDKYPNLEPLMKVANALEISLDELVGREVDNIPDRDKEEFVNKIASYFEEHWYDLKNTWLICDRSEHLRQMIRDAINERKC